MDLTEFDLRDKMGELILYIAGRSQSDERFGMTKLNKLLFYSDFDFFASTGKAITGKEYQRLPNGPAPRAVVPIVNSLQSAGKLAIQTRRFHGHEQKVPLALQEPDLTLFTASEISTVDYYIQKFWEKNASEISSASHEFVGWKLAANGETIPYGAVYLTRRPLTEQEEEWASELDMSDALALLKA